MGIENALENFYSMCEDVSRESPLGQLVGAMKRCLRPARVYKAEKVEGKEPLIRHSITGCGTPMVMQAWYDPDWGMIRIDYRD